MKTKIKFHKPGILTTLQDHGRLSLQDIGITKSGAASPSLMELGNALVENKNITTRAISINSNKSEFIII